MRNKYLLFIIIGSVLINLLLAWQVWAASSTDSPGGPAEVNGQMYTLDQIYDRLYDGRTSPKMTTFTEPAGGPGAGTMRTLDDIYTIVGQRAPVAQTGQTSAVPLDPAPTGSDGDLQRGAAWTSPRFTDNGDGTVFDNLTGLTWLKNAYCFFDVFGVRVWATALNDANTLNSGECGLSDGSAEGDWRLPNVRELQSLVDYGQYNPALPSGHPFTAVQSSNYWSSSTYAAGTSLAWYVGLYDGYVYYGNKTDTIYVWPVRGGQ